MPASLSLSPAGHLFIHQTMDAENSTGLIHDKNIINAFLENPSKGLFVLARTKGRSSWSPALFFWCHFIESYLRALCQNTNNDQATAIPACIEDIDRFLRECPPMFGAEYSSRDVLITLWDQFGSWLCNEITSSEGGFSEFLAKHLPQWHQVGRVCFHLAENKNDAEYPFAFMATYAETVAKNNKVQYQPLSHALNTYVGEGNRQQLIKLLKPIYDASNQCSWVKELLGSKDIYYPLAWTINEAHQFLSSSLLLESSGLVLRLPDWWKKRARPKVQVTIGGVKTSMFNAETLLDFNVEVGLDGSPLTKEELNDILSSKNNLISLRGQWVEVDHQKLKDAIAHWEAIQTEVDQEGVSFVEGMRLLAGTSTKSNTIEETDNNDHWTSINAGPWLKEVLAQLRNPKTLTAKQPGKLLKAQLRPYQVLGLNWLDFLTTLGLGACLADDMGLGKTIQIIALLIMKQQQRKNKTTNVMPTILILPASLLSNWKIELEKFSPSIKALYFHASEMNKLEIEKTAKNPRRFDSYDLVLTTYGMLLRQTWLQDISWQLVILDEAQAIKNPSSRQTKAVKQLKGQARIALTGTPIENRLGDLWSLFDFLCPGLLASASSFKKYINEINKSENKSFAPLRQLVQPYILRRLKTDKSVITDLPEKTELLAWCGLSKEQAKLYVQSVNELKEAMDKLSQGEGSSIKRRGLVLSYLMRFKQICNHASQALGDGRYHRDGSGKFLRLAEICEEIVSRQEKVLIFTQFREMTEPLSVYLAEIFNQPGLVLHGGVPVKKRKSLVDRFQEEGGPPFFVLSLKAAGVGLNLTAASHVIHFDRWWNPAVENQATDRAFRIGQKKNVMVHKFVCRGTLEEKIHSMITDKLKLASDVLSDPGGAMLTELDDQALLDLVSLDLERIQC